MDFPFPSYKSPPLNEVSIGLQFQPLEKLKIPHFGLFWDLIRKDFPSVEHAPPILNKKLEPGASVPLPRVWFIENSETQLLQLQPDRINFNWRLRENADPYPRFHTIAPQFFRLLEAFEQFLIKADIGVIFPTVAELTYVNMFVQGREWNTTRDFAAVFKDFTWVGEKERFLPYPTNMSWAVSFELPDQKGMLNARLNEGFRVADEKKVLQLEMVANYPVQDVSSHSLQPWYALAHEWIVKGFDDLTQPKTQKTYWGREA